MAILSKDDLDPLAGMVEQELLLGRPLRDVIGATVGMLAPLVAPDPRWMALHKLWLSQKPRRAGLKGARIRRKPIAGAGRHSGDAGLPG